MYELNGYYFETDAAGNSYVVTGTCLECGADLCGFTRCECGWDAYEWAYYFESAQCDPV